MAIPLHRVTYTLRDAEGNESNATIYSNTVLDNGAGGGLITDAATLRAAINALTESEVVKQEITIQDQTPSTAVPAGNVDNEIQAKFAFYTSDATVSAFSIPGFDRALLEPNTSRVDTSNASVQAFLDAMTGASGTGVNAVDIRGASLVELKSALESYSRRRA